MKIIYPQDDGTVAVMAAHPALETSMPANEIGQMYVPKGKPFRVIQDSDLPEEEFWAAWRVDFTNNDGVGGWE